MLTPQDVRSVRFEKNMRGYRVEAVDSFLDRITEQLENDRKERESLSAQLEAVQQENERLKQSLMSYEQDGDILKSALINAQRMGENVIREANQKGEEIVRRASQRGDDIVRDANDLLQKANDRAEQIVNEALGRKTAEEREYDRIRTEVTRFKADVLKLYRGHVESLSRLPEYYNEKAEDTKELDPVEKAAAALEEKVTQTEVIPTVPVEETPLAADFWSKDENELKIELPPEGAATDYSEFQGVKFSE